MIESRKLSFLPLQSKKIGTANVRVLIPAFSGQSKSKGSVGNIVDNLPIKKLSTVHNHLTTALEKDTQILKQGAKNMFQSATKEVIKVFKFRAQPSASASQAGSDENVVFELEEPAEIAEYLAIEENTTKKENEFIYDSERAQNSISSEDVMIEVNDAIVERSTLEAESESSDAEEKFRESDAIVALLSNTQSAVAQSLLVLNNLEILSKEVYYKLFLF